MPAPVGSSITIYEAARGTGMTCMLFCVVLDIACIMCDIYCVPLALSFFLVADESNVGSLVGQKNSECSIYFSLTHQSATLLSLVVSFGLTIQQVHTGKKWTVCVKILVILKYSSLFFIPSASLFFFFLPWLTELSCAALSVWARVALLPPRSAGPRCSILTQLTAAPTPSQWILLQLFVRTQFCFVLFEKSLVKCKREDFFFFLLTDDTVQWWFKVMYVK